MELKNTKTDLTANSQENEDAKKGKHWEVRKTCCKLKERSRRKIRGQESTKSESEIHSLLSDSL